jgi:predicted ATP-dependent serine protease
VISAELRVNEAVRLGFTKIVMPASAASRIKKKYPGVQIIPVRSVYEVLRVISGE